MEREKPPGLGTAGFICGLLALIFALIPILNLLLTPILGILGIVLGGVGQRQAEDRAAPRALSTAGIVLGFLSLLVLLLMYMAVFG